MLDQIFQTIAIVAVLVCTPIFMIWIACEPDPKPRFVLVSSKLTRGCAAECLAAMANDRHWGISSNKASVPAPAISRRVQPVCAREASSADRRNALASPSFIKRRKPISFDPQTQVGGDVGDEIGLYAGVAGEVAPARYGLGDILKHGRDFTPAEITSWIDAGQTALCPKCGLDSVLGSASPPGIDDRFLRKMHQHHYAYRSK